MAAIHPTAVIEKGASLGSNVAVGAYCVIGANVTLHDGVMLHSHVAVAGHTTVGEGTQIFPFASVGHVPQDLKFKGEKSTLTIGKNCMIREHVTLNPGTEGGGMVTSVGDNCLLMIGVHIAHDCRVGNHVILANNATLAGHVIVGNHVLVGGLSAVHQFVRIGDHAVIGGMTGVEHDVIPYGSVMGERGHLSGLNLIGLKRRGFERENIHALRNAYKEIFESNIGTLAERREAVAAKYKDIPEVQQVIAFMKDESSRSLLTPKAGGEAS